MEEHADTKRLKATLRERLIASGAIKPSADELIKLASVVKTEEIAEDPESYFTGFGDDALPAPAPTVEVAQTKMETTEAEKPKTEDVATADVWHSAFRVRKSQNQPWLRKFVVYDVEIGDPILDNECWTFFIKDEEMDENGYLTQFTVDFQKKIDDVLRTTYCASTNGIRQILSREMPGHHESASHQTDRLVMKLSSVLNAIMAPIEKAIFTKKVVDTKKTVEAPKATTVPAPLPVLPKAAKTLVEAPVVKTAAPPPVPVTPPRPRRFSTKISDALPSVIIAPSVISPPNVEAPAVKTVVEPKTVTDPFDNSAIVPGETFQRVELPASQPRKTEPLNTTERMKSLLATLNEKPAGQDHASWQLVAAVLILGLIAVSLLGLGVKRAFQPGHSTTNAVTEQLVASPGAVVKHCVAMSPARLEQYFGQKDPKHYIEQTTDGSDPNRPYIKLGALGTGFSINDDDTLNVSKSKICWR